MEHNNIIQRLLQVLLCVEGHEREEEIPNQVPQHDGYSTDRSTSKAYWDRVEKDCNGSGEKCMIIFLFSYLSVCYIYIYL